MHRASLTLPMIRIVSLVLLLAFASVLHLGAQIVPHDPSLSVVTIEGPAGVNAYAAGDGTVWLVTKDHLFKVEPETNQLTSVAIEKTNALSMAVGSGSVWIVGDAHKQFGVHRIDPVTGKCVVTIPLKRPMVGQAVYGEGALWLWNEGNLLRIDPNRNQIAATIQVGKGRQIEIGQGVVWIMGVWNGNLQRVDPQSSKVVEEFSVGPPLHDEGKSSYSLSVGLGSLWVRYCEVPGSFGCPSGKLFRIDPKTHERIATIPSTAGPPVFWNGFGWQIAMVDEIRGHFIVKLDPKTDHPVEEIPLPPPRGRIQASVGLVAGDNSLWTFSHEDALWARKSILIHRIQARQPEGGDEQK